MNKNLISTIAGAALSSLVATTGYAWPPTQACLDARLNHAVVMDTILVCKSYDPYGSWICSRPLRTVATQEKKDTLAIVRHECRGVALPDDTFFEPQDIEPIEFLPPPCPSVVGEWRINFDWNSDDSWGDAQVTLNADFTSTFSGEWSQNDCDFELRFEFGTNNTIYTGTMTSDGNGMDGSMSTTLGLGANGVWNALRVDPGQPSPPASTPSNVDMTPLDGSTD